MSQRYEFAILAGEARISFKELCRRFGISRKTGYKWRQRYREGGVAALSDRSDQPSRILFIHDRCPTRRRVHHCPVG